MTPFNTFLQALGAAGIDLTSGAFEMLFVTGYVPQAGDGQHDFENDITGAGGTIVHRQAVAGVTWVGRVLDAPDFVVNDPGAGTATYAILIKSAGTAATNRLIAYHDITDITFDGVNDQFRFNASGIFKIGA